MAKSFNMSHFKSQMRQAQQKAERQMRSEVNRIVRQYEQDVNRELRKNNAKVRHNQQIVARELNNLQSHPTVQNGYTVSLSTMHRHYTIVGATYQNCAVTPAQEHILDLVEQEQANGLITANAVEHDVFPVENTEDIEIGNKLLAVSEDLNNRWKGAVFALNPQNPDAARHFCTSAREIFTEFIDAKASNRAVTEYDPDCEKTPNGTPTRRAKIKYMMRHMDLDDSVADFADADIQNIVELFYVFNGATHGAAGKYDYQKLLQVKRRVEQGINFLCEIAA